MSLSIIRIKRIFVVLLLGDKRSCLFFSVYLSLYFVIFCDVFLLLVLIIMIFFFQALAETNALLARALALHFAVDTSASWGSGGGLRRACCELAFQDVADVRVRGIALCQSSIFASRPLTPQQQQQ